MLYFRQCSRLLIITIYIASCIKKFTGKSRQVSPTCACTKGYSNTGAVEKTMEAFHLEQKQMEDNIPDNND